MDVLRPPIIQIGKRFYRKNPTKETETEQEAPYQEEDEYEFTEDDVYADEVCDAFTQVVETNSGFKLTMSIPAAYYGYIIGKKGETRRRIENETKTQIRIPRQGEEGDVAIHGQDRKGVLSAKTRLDVLVDSARQKQPFTHFLSFPVIGDQIKAGFGQFKTDILKECEGDRGIDSTIFQNPCKLHITIGTLALMNDSEINQALDLLYQCKTDIVQPCLDEQPLEVSVEGLEYMNDDPSEVDVLYAQVHLQDGSDKLQMLADKLADRFRSAGLMQKDYDRVKLHLTVMNTLMRRDPSGTSVPRGSDRRRPMKDRESFNANNVLKVFGGYRFGTYRIGELHLSDKYSTGCNGYYSCTGKIDLP